MRQAALLRIFAASVILISFMPTGNRGFTIIGTASGFEENEKLYLSVASPDGNFKIIDSTLISKEKFVFRGVLDDEVVRAVITTKDYSDYKLFWLENADFRFNAQNGILSNGVVVGSETQEDENELDSASKSGKDKKLLYFEFILNHPNSIISVNFLAYNDVTWRWDTLSMLYNGLSKKMKGTMYGRAVKEFLSIDKNLKIGDKYANFSEFDPKDKRISLSHFKGKVLLIEFWASWCGPCRAANPELIRIYNEFKPRGFEILGIGLEKSKQAWLNAIKADKLPWTNVTDLQGGNNEAALIYGVWAIPSNFLIDRRGIIIGRDIYGDSLRNKLKELF